MKKPPTMNQLAKQLSKKAQQRDYTKGHVEEKVWINFQVSKGLKRDFREQCKLRRPKVNASEFVRACIELFLHDETFYDTIKEVLKRKEDVTALNTDT